MLPALSQFKINHVGPKSSPTPIPLLPTLHNTCVHRRCVSLVRSSPSSSSSNSISAVKVTCHVETDSATHHLERCFEAPVALNPPSMKGGQYGSLSTVTLEKSKLDLTQKQTKSSPELDVGGGGGGIGKKINHGGGDGGDDDGDDDDYFDDFDDGDEGDDGGLFRRRILFEELFDRKFVDAVLNEWQKTMMDLPAGLRQAYEMGLVSSAQMVKFLAINARPTTSRFISRTLPQALSRSFIGRLLADPAFLYRFLLEEAATIGCSVWWEFKNRKDRIKQEWDLALINVLTAATCNALVVWSLAPCRSYGNTFRFDLQNTLQKLPNNIFEKSYPLREFDLQKRIQCFLFKAAELCMVGLSAGAVQGALSNSLASKKEERYVGLKPNLMFNSIQLSEQALTMFSEMQWETKPTKYTFGTLLLACANTFALYLGKQVHGFIIRHEFQIDTIVRTALVYMYCKCRCLEYAIEVLKGAVSRDVIIWNTIILGCCHNHRGKEALELFATMEAEGIKPDHVTFKGILLACIEEGLVEFGTECFKSMSSEYHVLPRLEHYECMIELYSLHGYMNELEKFMRTMTIEPTLPMLERVLDACQKNECPRLGEWITGKIKEFKY